MLDTVTPDVLWRPDPDHRGSLARFTDWLREHRGVAADTDYAALRELVARARAGLVTLGVGRGDRVVALVPNSVETLVTFLATASLGAIWSSCSPDFGARAVHDRFAQIEPAVLLAVDGYVYGGKRFDIRPTIAALREQLPTLRATVVVGESVEGCVAWEEFTGTRGELAY